MEIRTLVMLYLAGGAGVEKDKGKGRERQKDKPSIEKERNSFVKSINVHNPFSPNISFPFCKFGFFQKINSSQTANKYMYISNSCYVFRNF